MSDGGSGRPIVISGQTGIYVHLAHPSAHVRTPQVFNAAFAERGIDMVAISADVEPRELGAFVAALRPWRNLVGGGVTIPHKEAIVDHLDVIEGDAEAIGAVNALRRLPDGRIAGRNTDGEGFVRGMLDSGHDPGGRRAILVGTGGAGRAIAFALLDAGVERLDLANRSRVRAEALAADLRAHRPGAAVRVTDAAVDDQDLLVNASKLGMDVEDPLPVPEEGLAPGLLVAEIVMNPARTRLLEVAESHGCEVHPGLPMLTSQIDLVLEYLEAEHP